MLPHQLKVPGWLLVAAGTISSIFYLTMDFRIEAPVFAIISYYLEPKFLVSFSTNIADELIMLCLLGGFFLVVFSKDNQEENDSLSLKGRALFKALFYNCIFLFFSILFIYGQAFMLVLVLNMFSVLLLYLVFRKLMKINKG
jgi:hypothetical protein